MGVRHVSLGSCWERGREHRVALGSALTNKAVDTVAK